jgi:hypothetical protein
MPLERPANFEKFEESASVIDKAIEGFSATIMTVQGLFTCSVLKPYAYLRFEISLTKSCDSSEVSLKSLSYGSFLG